MIRKPVRISQRGTLSSASLPKASDPVDAIYKRRAAVHEAHVQGYARTSRVVSYGRVATFLASACCFGVAVFASL